MSRVQYGEFTPIKVGTSAPYREGHSCGCIGPQNGEPMCPCMMRANRIVKRNGRWVQPERDLGPANNYGGDLRGLWENMR